MALLPLVLRRAAPDLAEAERVAIVDIGSNSIRLVVYDRLDRAPSILFNEKVMAGLGSGLATSGALDPAAVERGLAAIRRFHGLIGEMRVGDVRTVATAAVRDAANGGAFLTAVEAIGLPVTLLSGEEEAAMAAYGVIAGIPEADGIVGDLGGGSLELVRVKAREIGERASFPLGVLRLPPLRSAGERTLDRHVARLLADKGWDRIDRGLPFYLVGGSWRALARLDMQLTGYPLPIVHHYRMAPERPAQLVRALASMDKKELRAIPALGAARVPTLPDAAALLAVLARRLGMSELIVSANGLREGLLYAAQTPEVRRQDPLVIAARAEGMRSGRFPEHGDLLDRWLTPLFGHEEPAISRIRHAACLLSDIGWRAHPEFRAERGLDIAVHGNWVGINARERAMLGHALFVNFGGPGLADVVAALATPADVARAARWGLAMRLGHRLSGGTAHVLEESRLSLSEAAVRLQLPRALGALYGEVAERRHKALAAAFSREAVLELS